MDALTANPDLPSRLRLETRDLHERLEGVFGLPDSLPDYRRQLLILHGFVTPIEQEALSRAGLPAELLHGRAKADLLAADLERCDSVLGPASRRLCTDLPRMETLPQATGVMYVLEGSTLGGQGIARHVRIAIGSEAPCAYHQSYGAQVHAKWEQFRDYLRRIETADDQQTVVMSARETFTKLGAWAETWLPHSGICAA